MLPTSFAQSVINTNSAADYASKPRNGEEFLQNVLTTYGVKSTQLSDRLETYLKNYNNIYGKPAKDMSAILIMLSEQLSNTNSGDPLETMFLQFVKSNPQEATRVFTNFFHGDFTRGNGSEYKNELTGILAKGSSDLYKNVEHTVLTAEMYENGGNPNRDRNTPYIASSDSLGNALKYYQRAADLGHVGAAAKVSDIQHHQRMMHAAAAHTAPGAAHDEGHSVQVQNHHRHVMATERRVKEQHEQRAAQADAQNKKIADASAAAAQRVEQNARAASAAAMELQMAAKLQNAQVGVKVAGG